VPTKNILTLETLLARKLPTSTVQIGEFTLELQALKNKDLDDMITRHPPEKDSKLLFNEDLRYELVSRCVTNVSLSVDEARELLDSWARPDVSKLLDACFAITWTGEEAAKVPLSGNGSGPTQDTLSN
jgi:hypothetical protein